MLSTLAGLPAHPLFVHFGVGAAPVAALLSLALLLGTKNRLRFAFPALLVSALAVIAIFLTRVSGEELMKKMGFSEENPGPISDHALYANYATAAIIVLLVANVVVYLFTAPRFAPRFEKFGSWAIPLSLVVVAIAAIATLVTVVMTGHEGAVLTWTK